MAESLPFTRRYASGNHRDFQRGSITREAWASLYFIHVIHIPMNENIILQKEEFQNFLEQLSESKNIAWYVASEAREHNDVGCFFDDILTHGCICGMIPWLVYNTDIYEFFDEHYEEICWLRQEVKDAWMPVKIWFDLKVSCSFFAFEQTAYRIASDWGVL